MIHEICRQVSTFQFMETEFIIVGAGLAGCTLAWELHKMGKSIVIIDANEENTSSKVAAGLINPIVPKGVRKTWKCDHFFNDIGNYYADKELFTNVPFFKQYPLYQIHKQPSDLALWAKRSSEAELNEYLFPSNGPLPEVFTNYDGYTEVRHSGRLDVAAYCEATVAYLHQHHQVIQKNLLHNSISPTAESVILDNIQAKKIIFCEGIRAMDNPWFSFLPFHPTAGDILTLKIQGLDSKEYEAIYKCKEWLVPDGNGNWLAGSTFHFNTRETEINILDANKIVNGLKTILNTSIEVMQHKRAVRPTVQQRRPFLGVHPIYSSMAIFNGLGSKGSSLVTWLAPMMANFLVNQIPLDPEVDITRFDYFFE
jgi:glycine oxidase